MNAPIRKPKTELGSSESPARVAVTRMIDAARSVARVFKYLPDRVFHSRRREQALEELAARAPMRSAVFICHGNVCRSPYAAYLFSRLATRQLATPVAVSSAGFVGPGRQSPAQALAAAARRNIDMTAHRSMLVGDAPLASTDLIVVMSAEQRESLRQRFAGLRGMILILGDLDPDSVRRRTVVDPWGGDDALFDESYDRIDRCINALVNVLAAKR
jgi:protein-tyrosine-phosphatase